MHQLGFLPVSGLSRGLSRFAAGQIGAQLRPEPGFFGGGVLVALRRWACLLVHAAQPFHNVHGRRRPTTGVFVSNTLPIDR
jgi:hypothetical protein